MSHIDVNTVSEKGTHFLAAVELIKAARSEFNIPSENWPSPTEYRYGFPQDNYYAEVWVDGMDWQPTYWIIESENLNNPVCLPFIIFDSNEGRARFNDYDFRQLIQAMMHFRRDSVWIKQDAEAHYRDTVWSSTERMYPIHEEHLKNWNCDRFVMEHASQKPAPFFANLGFIPAPCITPQHYYDDWKRMLRAVEAHPYPVSVSHTKGLQRDFIVDKGQQQPTVDYIGFNCTKSGTNWYISKETAEETRNLASSTLDEKQKVNLNLLIDSFNEEEKEARKLAVDTLLENVNANVKAE